MGSIWTLSRTPANISGVETTICDSVKLAESLVRRSPGRRSVWRRRWLVHASSDSGFGYSPRIQSPDHPSPRGHGRWQTSQCSMFNLGTARDEESLRMTWRHSQSRRKPISSPKIGERVKLVAHPRFARWWHRDRLGWRVSPLFPIAVARRNRPASRGGRARSLSGIHGYWCIGTHG